MSDVQPFAPGTVVRKKKDLLKVGVITNDEPIALGSKVKQKVLWNDGETDFVNIRLLEPNEEKELTVQELIQRGQYGRREDLRSGITRYRLSGVIDNIIYSLNLTKTEFYPYQFIPLLTFNESLKSSLLIADEVGLGKTIEAGLIWTELQMRENAQRLLVVCPASLCLKWQKELADKFSIEAEIVNAAELLDAIRRISTGEKRSGVYIASLQGIRPPKGWDREGEARGKGAADLARALSEMGEAEIFNMMILDEAHHIRNQETQQYKGMDLLRGIAEKVLFLSATPIQTKSENLFSLLNILDPDSFPYEEYLGDIIRANRPLVALIGKLQSGEMTSEGFQAAFREIAEVRRRSWKEDLPIVEEILASPPTDEDLRKLSSRIRLIRTLNRLNPLSQIMVRSLKRHVMKERVARQPVTVAVEMTDAERAYYSAVTEGVWQYALKNDKNDGFMQCIAQRQMASSLQASLQHWSAGGGEAEAEEAAREELEGEETEERPSARPLFEAIHAALRDFPGQEELLRRDTKLERLLEIIRKFQQEHPGEKILLFSFFKKTLAYLEEKLSGAGISCVQISGDLNRTERDERIRQFRDGDICVLLSSEVAAEGIDLQFVSCMVNYDLPWNPAKIEQRIGRIDRIGQQAEKILIFNFVYEGTIEARIYRRLLWRLNVFKEALGEAEEVLGECLKDLVRDLFTRRLTDAEQDQRIQEACYAIENNRQVKDEAEASSLLYDMMQERVQAAQEMERFVLDADLLDFVRDFCRRDKGGSKLFEEPPGSGLYELALSAEARVDMSDYFQEHAAELPPTELLSNHDLKLRFRNKQGTEPRGIERVTQNHPLVKFVTDWNGRHRAPNYQLSAVTLKESAETRQKLKDVKPGTYVYRADYWRYAGIKRAKGQLAYAATDAETGASLTPDQAEILVNLASRQGVTFNGRLNVPAETVLDLDDSNEEALGSRFAEYRDDMCVQTEGEARSAKLMYEKRLEDLDKEHEWRLVSFEWEEREKTSGVKGRRAIYEKKYQKKRDEVLQKIEEIEHRLTRQDSSEKLVSAGIIRLEP